MPCQKIVQRQCTRRRRWSAIIGRGSDSRARLGDGSGLWCLRGGIDDKSLTRASRKSDIPLAKGHFLYDNRDLVFSSVSEDYLKRRGMAQVLPPSVRRGGIMKKSSRKKLPPPELDLKPILLSRTISHQSAVRGIQYSESHCYIWI